MKQGEKELIILLTGTITPNSLTALIIKDPEIRRQQYLEAINFYIETTKLKIVFTENSGAALDDFPRLPERIEYLTFNSASIHPDRGIGYKEMEIINFALQNSAFLKEARMIIKITGRLKVLNLNKVTGQFLKLRESNSNLIYANAYKSGYMDSRCFLFTIDFWPYLKGTGENINLKYNFEAALWDASHRYQSINDKSYMPLRIPLRIKGTSGSFGVTYKHSRVYHYARYFRNLIRRIL